MGNVKMGLALVTMAGVMAGCGGGTSEVSGSDMRSPTPPAPETRSVVDEATPVVDAPVPTTAPPKAPAPQPAPPSRRAAPAPGPAATAPAPVPSVPDAPPAPEYPTAGRSCEDNLERVDGLGALGADCPTAVRVAAGYDAQVMGTGEFPDHASLEVGDGWRCGSTVSGEPGESFSVLCDRGDPRMEAVSFSWGV